MKKSSMVNGLILLCILTLALTACRVERSRVTSVTPTPPARTELVDAAIEYELETVEETEAWLYEIEVLLKELEDLP